MVGYDGVAGNAESEVTFRANGVFDPNPVGGVGTQISARGHYDLTQYYNRYKVLASKFRATQINMRQVSSVPVWDPTRYYMTLYSQGNSHQGRTAGQYFENSILQNTLAMTQVKQQTLGNTSAGYGPFKPIVLNKSWKLSDWKAKLKDYDPSAFTIETSGDPNGTTEPAFHYMFHRDNKNILEGDHLTAVQAAIDGSVTAWMIEIEYDVLYSDPKERQGQMYTNE